MINNIKASLLIQEEGFRPANADWDAVAEKIYQAQEMKRELDMQIKLWMNTLIALSNNQNTCGQAYYSRLIERKGAIDYGAIPQLKKIDLEAYRKNSSSYWKLDKY